MNKIAVLTSGGDAPGMNAAIRAVVRTGCSYGMEVFGIERGYAGLLEDAIIPLTKRSVSGIIERGGTMLKTARCTEFKTPEGQAKGVEIIRRHGIEGVVVIGGDGSFQGAKALTEHGIPSVGIPGTIDNDLAYTDFTLGFDTACNTVLDAVNRIRDTMDSHDRISIVEVMGNRCGDLALYCGVCCGAEVVLVPEMPWSEQDVADTLTALLQKGKRSAIVIMAEGCGHAYDLEKALNTYGSFDIRTTVLGHIQRGGSPTMMDRLFGTECGVRAVELLHDGKGNRVVGVRASRIIDLDITEALSKPHVFKEALYRTVNVVGR